MIYCMPVALERLVRTARRHRPIFKIALLVLYLELPVGHAASYRSEPDGYPCDFSWNSLRGCMLSRCVFPGRADPGSTRSNGIPVQRGRCYLTATDRLQRLRICLPLCVPDLRRTISLEAGSRGATAMQALPLRIHFCETLYAGDKCMQSMSFISYNKRSSIVLLNNSTYGESKSTATVYQAARFQVTSPSP